MASERVGLSLVRMPVELPSLDRVRQRLVAVTRRAINPPSEFRHQTRAEMDPRLRNKLDDLARQIFEKTNS